MDLALITQSRNMFIIIVIILTLSINSSYQFMLDIDCINGLNKGINYYGTVSVTENRTPCSVWGYNNVVKYYADHNYCRNPDNSDKTWCFIDNPAERKWQYCNITYCGYLCPDLLFSPHMAQPTNLDKYGVYADVTFKCALGYELSGQRTLTCRYVPGDSMASWNHQQPTCSEINCYDGPYYEGVVNVTEHGRPCLNWKSFDSGTVHYYPNHNYCRNPDKDLKPWCYVGGTDRYQFCNITECGKMYCPELPYIEYMRPVMKTNGYRFPDLVVISCQTGYIVKGNDQLQCTIQGQWTTPTPSCLVIECEAPPSIDHMIEQQRRDVYHYLDTIMFSCRIGYVLSGTAELQCGPMAECNAPYPSCIGILCPEFPNVEHMRSNTGFNSFRYPDNVTITCDNGYMIQGTGQLSCTLNGTWSTPTPQCIGVLCHDFPYIEHMKPRTKLGSFRYPAGVFITCDKGYAVHNTSLLNCTSGGTWSIPTPKCAGVPCPDPNISTYMNNPKKLHGYSFPETIHFSCVEDYFINGESTIQCSSYGEWKYKQPTCQRISSLSLKMKMIIGGVGGTSLVFIPVLIVIVFLKRRQRRKSRKEYKRTQKNETAEPIPVRSGANDLYADVRTENNLADMGGKAVYYNEAEADGGENYSFTGPQIPQRAIKIDELCDYVENGRGDDGKLETEFKEFKSGLQKSTQAAVAPGNKSKNKYKDMYPYDETRVILDKIPNNSDYINASFIHGPDQVKKYIASQGPLQNTDDDFWKMVWQYECGKIVMLTNVFEDGKQKCVQYWPDQTQTKIKFGSIDVILSKEDVNSDFTVRTFKIQKDKDTKTVIQFHFTSWPDKGVPKYASSVVHFRHKVNSTSVTTHGPVIVHCSAGVGRTGTFIGLDFLIQQAQLHGYVDVFGCVECLRSQRVNMVQTKHQYVFLHEAVLEALLCPNVDISTREFPEMYKELIQFDDKQKKHKLRIEYERMNLVSPKHDEMAFLKGKSTENKAKNRYSNIIPVGSGMPMLFTTVDGHNEYINAVFLPGYKNNKTFIVTQMPLESTIIDLWRLVYDYDIPTIVMLNHNNQNERNKNAYWPAVTAPITFGPFKIEQTLQETEELYECRYLSVSYRNKEHRQVKLFQSKFWKDDVVVPISAGDIITFLMAVENCHEGRERGPILVHCLNGCDKSGLYCVLATVIERLRIEQEVDIPHVIKQMRNRRPQIIPNYAQFQFIYEAVMEYLKQFETYSNFQ